MDLKKTRFNSTQIVASVLSITYPQTMFYWCHFQTRIKNE